MKTVVVMSLLVTACSRILRLPAIPRRLASSTAIKSSSGGENISVTPSIPGEHRCSLVGFPKSGSRLDLELLLGELKPLKIDPLLTSKKLLFTGVYNLEFSTKEEIQRLDSVLKSKAGNSMHLLSGDKELRNEYVPASRNNLSQRSVIINDIPLRVPLDGCYRWLAGYNLARPTSEDPSDNQVSRRAIRPIFGEFKGRNNVPKERIIIVDCASVEEARRLVSDKMNTKERYEDFKLARLFHLQA